MGKITFSRLPVSEHYIEERFHLSASGVHWYGYIGVQYEWLSFQENYNPPLANLKLRFSFNGDAGNTYTRDQLNIYVSVNVFGTTYEAFLPQRNEIEMAVPLSGIDSYFDDAKIGFKIGSSGSYSYNYYYIHAPCKLEISYPDTITSEETKSITVTKYGATNSKLSLSVLTNSETIQSLSEFVPTNSVYTISLSTPVSTYARYFPTMISGCYLEINARWNRSNVSLYHDLPALSDVGTCVMDMTPSAALLKPQLTNLRVVEAADLPSRFALVFVKKHSKFYVSASLAMKYDAILSSGNVVADGKSYQFFGDNITTDIIGNSGTVAVSVTVTDSRGLTSTVSTSVTVTDWFPPQVGALSVHRGNYNSSTHVFTPDDNGAFCKIDFQATWAPVGNYNQASATLEYPDGDQPAHLPVSNYAIDGSFIAEADIERSYDIVLTLTDSLVSVTRMVKLSTAGVILDILSGGKGIGIGKISEISECIEFNPQWDVRCYGMTLADYIRSIVQQMN